MKRKTPTHTQIFNEELEAKSTILLAHSITITIYLTDYAITVVLIFPPLPPPFCTLHSSQAMPPPLFMFTGHVHKFFGYSTSYAVLYIPMAILLITYLYFLIPSSLHAFPTSPSHLATIKTLPISRFCLFFLFA